MIRTQSFPFIYTDVFLTAWIDTKTCKEKLIAEKIDPRTNTVIFSDELECIHTAIYDIPVEQHDPTLQDLDYYLKSTEHVEVKLSADERFKALCSWVAGIAEAGKDAIPLQFGIDDNLTQNDLRLSRFVFRKDILNSQVFPISLFLIKFLIKIDPEFIYDYIQFIEMNKIYEGIQHDSFIIASLAPIVMELSMMEARFRQEFKISHKAILPKFEQYWNALFSLNPPMKLFLHNVLITRQLERHQASKLPYFSKFLESKDPYVVDRILSHSNFSEHPSYIEFVKSNAKRLDYILCEDKKYPSSRLSQQVIFTKLNEEDKAAVQELHRALNFQLPIINDEIIRELEFLGYHKTNYPHLLLNRDSDIVDINLLGLSLHQIPQAVYKFPKLKHLALSNNPIHEVPKELLDITLLEALGISKIQLKTLPSFLNDMNLIGLRIDDNKLKVLDVEAINPDLRFFSISNNEIEVLPDLSRLTRLINLDVSKNNLTEIPDLSNLNSLVDLNASNNNLTRIPELPISIRFLDLCNNYIKEIPKKLISLKNLQSINLEFNKIENFPKNLYSKWKSLVFFYHYPYIL